MVNEKNGVLGSLVLQWCYPNGTPRFPKETLSGTHHLVLLKLESIVGGAKKIINTRKRKNEGVQSLATKTGEGMDNSGQCKVPFLYFSQVVASLYLEKHRILRMVFSLPI
jgi:hypothetical protein